MKNKAYELKMLLVAGLAACKRARILIKYNLELNSNINQAQMKNGMKSLEHGSGDTSRLI